SDVRAPSWRPRPVLRPHPPSAPDHRLFANRVPRPAPLAPPYPLGMLVPALSAAIDRPRPRHGSGRLLSRGEAVEAGELAAEPEGDVTGWAIAMLGQHD